jgi:hypothetical protein
VKSIVMPWLHFGYFEIRGGDSGRDSTQRPLRNRKASRT